MTESFVADVKGDRRPLEACAESIVSLTRPKRSNSVAKFPLDFDPHPAKVKNARRVIELKSKKVVFIKAPKNHQTLT